MSASLRPAWRNRPIPRRTRRASAPRSPQNGQERTFTIVGVDEASVKDGRIAFTAPVARALLGKRKGEEAAYALGAGTQRVLVRAVVYS